MTHNEKLIIAFLILLLVYVTVTPIALMYYIQPIDTHHTTFVIDSVDNIDNYEQRDL